MRSKKLLSVLAATTIAASALAGFAVTAGAASLDDAKTITADMTYWFDDANGNGTTAIGGETVFGEYFYTPYGHNAATNKGTTIVDDVAHYNSLRVKSATQDRFAFTVGAAATITFYTQSHASRGIVITGSDYTTSLAAQEYATTTFVYTVDSAQTIYVTANGDFFLAGVSVDIVGEAPSETEPPAETEPPVETEPPAETEPPSETEPPAEATLKSVSETTTWTQANFAQGGYQETVLSDNKTLEINGAAGKAVSVDANAIKLGGTGSAESRNVRLIPGEDGTVKVTAVNGNTNATDRYFVIETDGEKTNSDVINTTASVELTVNVKANVPVYIYSGKSGVNITEIVYTVGSAQATDEPSGTEPPSQTDAPVQTKLAKDAPINAADLDQNISYTSEAVLGALKIAATEEKKIDVNSNVIKLGGTGSTASRYVSVIPAEAGTLTISFKHGGAAEKVEERSLVAATAGGVLGSKTVTNGGEEAELVVDVEADKEVFIYSGRSGINIVSIALGDTAVTPNVVEASKDDAQDITGDTDGSVASLWNGIVDAVSATKVTAVVTDNAGITHDGSADLGGIFDGSVQVYVVVNHAKADIDKVTLSFE